MKKRAKKAPGPSGLEMRAHIMSLMRRNVELKQALLEAYDFVADHYLRAHGLSIGLVTTKRAKQLVAEHVLLKKWKEILERYAQ